jgi:hypothetical protein
MMQASDAGQPDAAVQGASRPATGTQRSASHRAPEGQWPSKVQATHLPMSGRQRGATGSAAQSLSVRHPEAWHRFATHWLPSTQWPSVVHATQRPLAGAQRGLAASRQSASTSHSTQAPAAQTGFSAGQPRPVTQAAQAPLATSQ